MRGLTPLPNAELQREHKRERLWLALILALAAALRLWGLEAKSLWLDEIMTVQKASMPFPDMMAQIRKHDAHPPLFQIVEWLWLRMGGGDAFARLPSALAGVAGVWLAVLIARRLFGRNAALAAGTMTALSYFNIFYSQEARLYSLTTTLFVAQICLLLRILDARGKAGWGLWIAYGLLGLLSLYTYSLCALTVGSLGLLHLWLTWRRGPQIRRWLAVHAAIALLFLPWVPILTQRTEMLEESVRQRHDVVGRPTFSEITTGVASWGIGPAPWEKLGRLGALLGAGLTLAAAIATARREIKRPAKVLGVLFFLPLLGYLLLPMPRVHVYEAKHLIFLQPLLLIALSGARATPRRAIEGKRFHPLVYAVLAIAALNILGLRDYYTPGFQKEDWRGLARDVTAQLRKNDLVLFNPGYVGYAFDYYSPTSTDKAGAESLLQPRVQMAKQYGRIWLVEDRSAVARPWPEIPSRLEALGWKPEETRSYSGAIGELRWTRFAHAP